MARASDPEWFRTVMAQYPTGVAVVTGIDEDGRPAGLAVGSFTSASLTPPLIAFFPGKSSSSWPRIRTGGRFCVNVLGADQEHVCRVFASRGKDKFAAIDWRPSPSGCPILAGVVSWLDCEIDAEHEVGDHYMVIGRVVELEAGASLSPLVFHRGGYGRFAPESLAVGDVSFAKQLRLVDLARGEMEATAARIAAQVFSGHMADRDILILATAGEASTRGLLPTRIGQRIPAFPPLGALWMAFADERAVEEWLKPLNDEDAKDIHRRRLREIRQRGYSVGLAARSHAAFETMMDERSAGAPLTDEEKSIVQSLPFDVPEFSPDSPGRLRSVHFPAFAADGTVALSVSAVGFPQLHSANAVDNLLDEVGRLAAHVTTLVASSEPRGGKNANVLIKGTTL